jgi:hypothetical protein
MTTISTHERVALINEHLLSFFTLNKLGPIQISKARARALESWFTLQQAPPIALNDALQHNIVIVWTSTLNESNSNVWAHRSCRLTSTLKKLPDIILSPVDLSLAEMATDIRIEVYQKWKRKIFRY